LVLSSVQWELLQKNGSFTGMSLNVSQGSDGSYTIKMTESEWGMFQANQSASGGSISGGQSGGGSMSLNVTMDTSGYYIMVLTSAQWEMLQGNGSFNGMSVNASQGADGSFTIKMSEAEWNIFQSNQSSTVTKQQSDPQQLQVTMDASGNYIMTLTQVQFEMLQNNGSFNGMRISASQSNGQYVISMSEAEWQVFQSNQASAGGTTQSSGECVLNMEVSQFEALKASGGFNGISMKQSVSGSTVTIRMSEKDFKKFQSAQGGNVNIGKDQLSADGGQDVGKVQWGLPEESRTYGTAGKLEMPDMSGAEHQSEQRSVGKLKGFEQEKVEAVPKKKVGKLNMGAFGGGEEKAPPPKRTGKLGSRFGSKFGGGSDLQKDGGSEVQQLKSSMTEHRRALRPNRRAPTSNPVKQLEKRKDVFSEDN